MSPKSFLILAGATAIAVALAVVAVAGRDVPVSSRPAGTGFVSGLLDHANEVRTIRITGPGTATLTLVQGEHGWSLSEKAGYPAKTAKARDLVLQLANLQLIEAKTARADRLPRLELEDPGKEGTKSHLVELLAADGKPLATAVVGKTRYGLFGGSRSGIYVRHPGDPQAWLAVGTFELPNDALDLIDLQVIDVPLADVAKVTLGEGETAAVLHKAGGDAGSFVLDTPAPEGRQLDPAKADEVGGMLGALSMQDVKPAKEVGEGGTVRHSRVETFDGLVIDVSLRQLGEGEAAEYWLELQAGAGNADPAQPVAKRAAELQAKLGGWAYKVAPYLQDRLGAKLDNVLSEPDSAS